MLLIDLAATLIFELVKAVICLIVWIASCVVVGLITGFLYLTAVPGAWWYRRKIMRELKASIAAERTARAWLWYAKVPAPPMPEKE